MWQKLKAALAALKDVKSVLGLIPEAVALGNNHLFNFIPLSQLLRPWASVFSVLFAVFAVGLTASKINDKAGAVNLTRWLRRIAAAWAVIGFVVFGLYIYLIGVFEQHSYTPALSSLFDFVQVGLFAFAFVCWSVALTALVRLFSDPARP